MKIGIITMHRPQNYGSFLQTFATQYIFKKLGHQSEIIDYYFPNEWQYSRGAKKESSARKVLLALLSYTGLFKSLNKRRKLRKSLKKYCVLSIQAYRHHDDLLENPPSYDVYVTGSDQTWNPQQIKGDVNFLLAFAPAKGKRLSFSASMAQKALSPEDAALYLKHLKEYSAIAVREKNSVSFLEKLTGKRVTVTLDPTLMLNKQDWLEVFRTERLRKLPQSYILFYPLSYSFNPYPYIYELLEALQHKTGLKILSLERVSYDKNLDVEFVRDANVREFIELFANASYIVTSSFHGTAYALNFGRPLYSIVPNDYELKDSRQVDIIRLLGVDQCVVPIGKSFEEINPHYDYKMCQNNLNIQRELSWNYLKDSIGENKDVMQPSCIYYMEQNTYMV